MQIKNVLSELKADKNQIMKEVGENYDNFEEVWPHLLNIFEYKSKKIYFLYLKI